MAAKRVFIGDMGNYFATENQSEAQLDQPAVPARRVEDIRQSVCTPSSRKRKHEADEIEAENCSNDSQTATLERYQHLISFGNYFSQVYCVKIV